MNKKLTLLNIIMIILFFGLNRVQAQNQNFNQNQENLNITINNGDTIINGKNFKTISEAEKAQLRKKMNILSDKNGTRIAIGSPHIYKRVKMIKKMNGDSVIVDSNEVRFYSFNEEKPMAWEFKNDSLHRFKFYNNPDSLSKILITPMGEDNYMNIDPKMVHPRWSPEFDRMPIFRGKNQMLMRSIKPNSSNFNYTITDKDGFSTEEHINISDPSKGDLKSLFKDENKDVHSLEIKNLIFYPNFDSGKTTIGFTVPDKGLLSIKLVDNEGNIIFSENRNLTSLMYSRSFDWHKNGIYYLEVSSGKKSFIKKVIKN
ncbi:MAG: T9SS type A sorting domain-containing protein [Sphingobacteriales bacterium]|nr:T9SS type A sorting domain-containing protein [Sphingobacteriales bacterium]